MSNTKKKKRKGNPFHTPKTVGEKLEFHATPLIHLLSALSLVFQLAMTVVGIIGYNKFLPLNVAGPFGFNAAYMLLLLPGVMWLLTIVARVAFRALPLDMWRMPIEVRAGMVKCGGWLLKLATLLVELECSVAFLIIEIGLFTGFALNDTVMNIIVLCLLAALVVSVWSPCREAGKLGRGETVWTGSGKL